MAGRIGVVAAPRSAEETAPIATAPGAPAAIPRVDATTNTDLEPTRAWRFGAGALAGTTAGTTPQAVAAGSFFVELVRNGKLGVGIEGGLESARTSEAAWANQRWLTLYGKLGIPVSSRITFAATLGVRGWQIEAGAGQLAPTNLFAGGAALTLGAELELGPLVVLIRAIGAARFPEDRIRIAGADALFLKWWQVGGLAGLAWRFP